MERSKQTFEPAHLIMYILREFVNATHGPLETRPRADLDIPKSQSDIYELLPATLH